MPLLRHTPHFVPAARLPVVSLTTSLRGLFLALHEKQAGGVIVTAEAEPSYYMSGDHCRNAAQTLAARSGWPLVSAHLVHDVLTDPEIRPDLTNTTSFQGVAAVHPIPVLDTDDPGPQYGPDYTVYRIIDHQERPLGWFFNHEDLEATVRNPSPLFQCVNGHSNADTDSGYCSRCPGKLI